MNSLPTLRSFHSLRSGRFWLFASLMLWTVNGRQTNAQVGSDYLSHLPAQVPRINGTIDNSKVTQLRGSTHPLASAENDHGPASPDVPMERMLMLLRRSPEEEATFESLLASQQDPKSPLYHRWLTPSQVGRYFGPAQADVEQVTNWLGSQGFSRIVPSNGRTVIEFSGNVAQVESAFHTRIHRYQVNGVLHSANQTDPSIPAALGSVVVGIVSLHDFGHHSMAVRGPTLQYRSGEGFTPSDAEIRPQFTYIPDNVNFYAVGPYDFATLYDLVPLWKAGLDGSGQTIAIVGETEIKTKDVTEFREFFGLPTKSPKIIINGADPGFQDDEIEADLDVQWSGAIAKGANIDLVISASTKTTVGVDLSSLYIVDNNLAPVMSESYGDCELFLGTTGNAYENSVWQQAAAEGITVLVASGDQGSVACDPTDAQQNLAVHPMAVSGLASTPYNTAVGGTDFLQYNKWSQYWSDTNDPITKQSVLGYIPEIPWNDSCGSTTLQAIYNEPASGACNDEITVAPYDDTIATSGGPSTCIQSDGMNADTCKGAYPKPAWQVGTGVPEDGVRDVPDVSFFASNAVYDSSYVICDIDATKDSGCDPTASTQSFIGLGGTSASAPAMAGVMAIINQKYGRQGIANFALYGLAASSSGPSIFHDVTTDGNRVACSSKSPDCVIPAGAIVPLGTIKGHDSNVGYDLVTGLGSIDITNLFKGFALYQPDFSISASPSTLTVANGQTTAPSTIQVGAVNGFSGTVALSCSGLPAEAVCLFSPATINGAGNISLTISTTKAEAVGTTKLAGVSQKNLSTDRNRFPYKGLLGTVVLAGVFLPLRKWRIISLRAMLLVVAISTLTSCGGSGSGSGSSTPPGPAATATSITANTSTPGKGASDTFKATVSSTESGSSAPVGTVQFTVDGSASGTAASLANGSAQFETMFATAGTHHVVAAYSGDSTHKASTSPALTINVPYTAGSIPGQYTVTVTAASGELEHKTTFALTVE